MIIGEPIPTTGLRVRDMDKLTMQVRQSDCRDVLFALERRTFAGNEWRSRRPTGVDAQLRSPAKRTDMKPRIAIPTPNSTRPTMCYARCRNMSGRCARLEESRSSLLRRLPTRRSRRPLSAATACFCPAVRRMSIPRSMARSGIPRLPPADAFRDNADELLLQDAYNMRKPVFGICYGLQSLNVWRTGTLDQELPAGSQSRGRAAVSPRRIGCSLIRSRSWPQSCATPALCPPATNLSCR